MQLPGGASLFIDINDSRYKLSGDLELIEYKSNDGMLYFVDLENTIYPDIVNIVKKAGNGIITEAQRETSIEQLSSYKTEHDSKVSICTKQNLGENNFRKFGIYTQIIAKASETDAISTQSNAQTTLTEIQTLAENL